MTVLDDIRAQYPGAYDDLSDGQLASLYRKKYYADMPAPDFYRKAGLGHLVGLTDQPVTGISDSNSENFSAGAGKAVYDTGRGIAQAALALPAAVVRNAPDYAKNLLPDAINPDVYYQSLKNDQSTANARDAALMQTKAGVAGDIAGNIGLGLVGGAAAKGAGIAGRVVPATYGGAATTGSLLGAVQPLASNQTEASRLLNGGVGAAGGVVGQGIANGVGAAVRAGKGLLAPFFDSGQDQIVANTLSRFGGDAALNAKPSAVPGVNLDLAEQTGSAGISQLRRAVQDKEPSIAELFTDRQAQNNAARLGLLRQISGTADDVGNAKAWRDQVANAKYGQAFEDARSQQVALDQNLADAMKEDSLRRSLSMGSGDLPSETLISPKMADLAKRPIIQQAARQAQAIAANNGVDIGNPMGSLQGQHYIKMALDDALNTGPQMGIGNAELSAISNAKREFVNELERQNPSYKEARDAFRNMSAPANRLEVAQAFVNDALPNSATIDQLGNPILRPDAFGQAYDRLDKIAQQVTKQKRATASGILNQQQQDAIGGILGDLSQVKLASNVGKSAGSNTVQNLASQNLLNEVGNGIGLPGLADSAILNRVTKPLGLLYKAFGTDDEIRGKLASVILNPQSSESQAIIKRMTKPQRGLLANVSAQVGGLLGSQAAPATNQRLGR